MPVERVGFDAGGAGLVDGGPAGRGGGGWWPGLVARWAGWVEGHPVGVRRLRVARAVWLWGSLAWLLVLTVVSARYRESVLVFVQVYWLLLVWFWLARTRTISWRLVAGVFSVSLVWSSVVGVGLRVMAEQVGEHRFGSVVIPGRVRALGPLTAIAGVGEESAKLVPVVVLALLVAARVRRFAVVDWLLVGFAAGLGFQAFEELARRTAAHVLKPGLLDLLLGVGDRGPDSGYPQYGWGPLGGWSRWTPGTEFPGHHVTTALVTVAVGLGVVAWRRARGAGAVAGPAWRAGALAGPVLAWWLVVSVHAGGNATSAVGRKWLTAVDPSVPWLLRSGWQVARHGVGLRWLLLALLVVALLVDAARLRAGDAALAADVAGTDSDEQVSAVAGAGPVSALEPGLRADAWLARLTGSRLPAGQRQALRLSGRHGLDGDGSGSGARSGPGPWLGWWWRGFLGAGCALVAYVWRDVVVLVAGTARQPGESRLLAMLRGRAAGGVVRRARAAALARALGRDSPGRVRARLPALVVLVVLGWAVLWLAPHWAGVISDSPNAHALTGHTGHVAAEVPGWLAGVLDSLAQWWSGLPFGGKLLVGVGIAALVALSGGSLGLAFGISGVATYLLEHGRGGADFLRDPGRATRSYLATTTPMGMLVDGAEAVLTFAPGNFAGAQAGRAARVAAEDYLIRRGARASVEGWAGEGGLRLDGWDNLVADHALRAGAEAEASITPRLQSIVADTPNARLEGLDARLKTLDSFKGKVARDLLDGRGPDWLPESLQVKPPATGVASSIADGVRYTVTVPERGYGQGVTAVVRRLQDAGYVPVQWKNTWGGTGYRGINSQWRDPGSGRLFEVQFRTPASYRAKTVTHGLYEQVRLPGTPAAEILRARAEQNALFGQVPIPPGASEIGGPFHG